MLRLNRAQVDTPIADNLRGLWQGHAAKAGLPADQSAPLGDTTVTWLLQHKVTTPENVDFVMSANAQSAGAFLNAPEIHEAMRLSAPEYDMAVTVLRRQTHALALEARG